MDFSYFISVNVKIALEISHRMLIHCTSLELGLLSFMMNLTECWFSIVTELFLVLYTSCLICLLPL